MTSHNSFLVGLYLRFGADIVDQIGEQRLGYPVDWIQSIEEATSLFKLLERKEKESLK